MPEQWQCGHCSLIVELPDEVERPDLYHTAVAFIRDHRFGHIADRLMAAKTDEDIMALADEDLEPDPMSLLRDGPGERYWDGSTWVPVGPPDYTPITNDDVAPAVDEAEALLRADLARARWLRG